MVRFDFCTICAKEGMDLGGIDQVVGVAKLVLPLRAAVSLKRFVLITEESFVSDPSQGQADLDERVPTAGDDLFTSHQVDLLLFGQGIDLAQDTDRERLVDAW